MTTWRSGLVNFAKSYRYDESKVEAGRKWRDLAKGVLEVIRNIGVVAAIQYVAIKTDSLALKVIAEIGNIALAIVVSTYLTRYRFTGFDFVASPGGHLMKGIYTALPGIVVYIGLSLSLRHVVNQIVRSQGLP